MSDRASMALRSSQILRETKATQKIDDLKQRMAEILKLKMNLHNDKAQEYQKLETMLTAEN